MSEDGNMLPLGHLMTGARGSHEGNTGLVWVHRAVALPRGRHTPGRGCCCSPTTVSTDQGHLPPLWLSQIDTASLPN